MLCDEGQVVSQARTEKKLSRQRRPYVFQTREEDQRSSMDQKTISWTNQTGPGFSCSLHQRPACLAHHAAR